MDFFHTSGVSENRLSAQVINDVGINFVQHKFMEILKIRRYHFLTSNGVSSI